MNTQDRIKELIAQYEDFANDIEYNGGYASTYRRFIKSLESLLECEHKNTTVKQSGMFGMSLCKVCDDCNKILAKS